MNFRARTRQRIAEMRQAEPPNIGQSVKEIAQRIRREIGAKEFERSCPAAVPHEEQKDGEIKMAELSKSLAQIAWDELMGTACVCGKTKRTKESFCTHCYYKLPVKTRRALYTPMSEGYAEIYDEAKELLKGL